MDSTKFKEIFSKDIYQLPIRWDGKDFYATLYKHLKKYREDIEQTCDDSNLCATVKKVCRGLCAAVDFSFRGYPEKAYKRFEDVMEILGKDPLLVDKENINKEPLYRVVDVGNAAVPNRKRVFHVPFSMRSKMSTQRYSIPGFPSLYLGTSVDLCCMETGKDPQRDYVCVSRYELQTDYRVIYRIIDTNQRPVFDNDAFMIFDVSIKPEIALKKINYDEGIKKIGKRYIMWYPLISACSYIRAMRDDPYSAEYIIPQLFIQWVRLQDKDAVVGIKYFSCSSFYASTLGNNYVFPTIGTPYHARKTISDYCARLSHRFKLTIPRFIMEYDSINTCVEVMRKDNNLDYIEEYNTGEEEEIEGIYRISEGVSAIGAFAFSGCRKLKRINVPDSVTSIGDYAFSHCISLTSINIPDSVTSIGNKAFTSCSSLTSINIPDSVTSIGYGAFSCCWSLIKITVDCSNMSYLSVEGVLYSKDKTKLVCNPPRKNQINLEISTDVMSIGEYAFSGCGSLKSIKISDSVRIIGEYAFSSCDSLNNIKISDSVRTIGEFAFFNCSKLKSINIPDSVKSIGAYAFCDCISLNSVNISRNVETICDATFSNCKSLTTINIPDSVTTIGTRAFSNCRSLTSINIPESVTNLDYGAFSSCSSLMSINIPDSVISIGFSAFSGCSSLTNINIPDSVTIIGNEVFSACSSLTNINIPDSVISIGFSAFSGCRSLTSFDIPNNVINIENCAFRYCSSLISINIPESLISVGDFAFRYCNSLKTVYYSGTQEQAKKLNIGLGNEELEKATWVYGSSGGESES